MADFDILYNGASVTNVVIPSNAYKNALLMVQHRLGAAAAGKLVTIETSSLLYMSAVNGSLDNNGNFAFTVGPGFGQKGNVSLTVSAGSAQKKSLNIQFT